MTSHSRVATPTGTPGCLQLGPQWSPQHETPNPTNHLVLTLETGEATIFTPALPAVKSDEGCGHSARGLKSNLPEDLWGFGSGRRLC